MEAEEQAELSGAFKASTTRWILIVVAIAVFFLLVVGLLPFFTR
jgi:flagellar basal body-associated protein FliL